MTFSFDGLTQPQQTPPEEARAALQLAEAVVLALRAAPEGIPAGHLYALLMGRFTDVGAFEAFIAMLARTGFVQRRGDLLLAGAK